MNKRFAYVHLSNGDYDEPAYDLNHLCSAVDFEMGSGGQKYMIITKRKLSSDEYIRICEIIEAKQ